APGGQVPIPDFGRHRPPAVAGVPPDSPRDAAIASPAVHRAAPKRERSLKRNGALLPTLGVMMRKLSVTRNIPLAARRPTAEARGTHRRVAMSIPITSSITPMTSEP